MATEDKDDDIIIEIEGEEPDEKEEQVEGGEVDKDTEEEDEHLTDVATEAAETGEDREAIRERRRQERQDRKAKAREREDNLRRELSSRDSTINQLKERLDVIERRSTGGEMAQIKQAKEETAKAYAYYKDQIRVGTESQNGAAVADATEKLFQIRAKAEQLDKIEKSYTTQATRPPPMDPRVANSAKSWAEKNKWYDVRGGDQDSKVVLMLDRTLADEGWNPLTQEYWDELNDRVKKYLPHRASRDNITTRQKSVVGGSGRETPSNGGGKVFRLSAERVKALKEANKWDDPVERNKMIKQYRDYDKNNANDEGAR